jgi:dienelactone hydrolase
MALPARFRLIASCLAVMLCQVAPAAALDGYWTEPAYAEYPAKGPDKALGLVIWNHGADGPLAQYGGPPIPAVAGLAARGWDVVALNRNPVQDNSWANAGRRHVACIAAEVAAARKEGYRRIVVAGQSYGGAMALAAAGAVDGLWAVIATAPGTGQELRNDGDFGTQWKAAVAQQTYAQLRAAGRTRLVVVFPDGDELIGVRRGAEARAILREKPLPFLIVDETAPLKGHHAAYGDAFKPYATCIGYFLDPATAPPNGEFRCGHDEFTAVRSAIRAARPEALAGDGARWFGYFEKTGQEIVLSVKRGDGTPVVEYAWGKGVLGTFRPGAATLAAERSGDALKLRLAGGALVDAAPTASGGMRLTFAKAGQPPLVANLLPVGD